MQAGKEKLVIIPSLRAIIVNFLLVPNIFLLFQCSKGSWKKLQNMRSKTAVLHPAPCSNYYLSLNFSKAVSSFNLNIWLYTFFGCKSLLAKLIVQQVIIRFQSLWFCNLMVYIVNWHSFSNKNFINLRFILFLKLWMI